MASHLTQYLVLNSVFVYVFGGWETIICCVSKCLVLYSFVKDIYIQNHPGRLSLCGVDLFLGKDNKHSVSLQDKVWTTLLATHL